MIGIGIALVVVVSKINQCMGHEKQRNICVVVHFLWDSTGILNNRYISLVVTLPLIQVGIGITFIWHVFKLILN